jgi:excisionase family DNA binding protein
MTKQEAADYLGCSVRQLERYTSENRIGVRYEKGRTRPSPVYEESEVAAFKAALETPVYRGVVTSAEAPPIESRQLATQSDGGLSALSQAAQFEAMARVLAAAIHRNADSEKRALTVPEIAAKPLLKLDEAATLTGLSRATLRTAIAGGELEAKQIGRAWRIKRAALDRYIEGL